MTLSPTRWGIMSAGLISHDWAVAVSTLPKSEHQILAVSARSKENAEKFAEEHKIPRAYGSYVELCQDKEIGEPLIESIDQVIFHTDFFQTSFTLEQFIQNI